MNAEPASHAPLLSFEPIDPTYPGATSWSQQAAYDISRHSNDGTGPEALSLAEQRQRQHLDAFRYDRGKCKSDRHFNFSILTQD